MQDAKKEIPSKLKKTTPHLEHNPKSLDLNIYLKKVTFLFSLQLMMERFFFSINANEYITSQRIGNGKSIILLSVLILSMYSFLQ